MRAQTIVVQVEMLKRYVCCEECDERRLSVETKSVVVQVNRVEIRQVEDGREQVGERLRDLAQETAGEDVGEVCDLGACQSCRCQVPQEFAT